MIKRKQVIPLIYSERARLETKLKTLARRFNNKRLSLNDLIAVALKEIKYSMIRLSLLATNDLNLSSQHIESLQQIIQVEILNLNRFAQEIELKAVSPKQIINRLSKYGQASTLAYWTSENITYRQNSFTLAKRVMNPDAKHCPDCINLSTFGQWLPISQVTVPGHSCQCRGNCKCIISYRK